MGALREMFGSSQEEIWKQLSAEIGAEFVDGGTWNGDKVVAHVKEWSITLDNYVVMVGKVPVTMTRMRAPYVNRDNFRFEVSRKNFFTGLSKALGMQDVEIGDAAFDDAFVIKGNDEAKLKALFANAKIRQLLSAQSEVTFEVNADEGWFGAQFPEGVDELTFQVTDGKNKVQIKALFELFAEVLNHLCVIGSAYEDAPNVTL